MRKFLLPTVLFVLFLFTGCAASRSSSDAAVTISDTAPTIDATAADAGFDSSAVDAGSDASPADAPCEEPHPLLGPFGREYPFCLSLWSTAPCGSFDGMRTLNDLKPWCEARGLSLLLTADNCWDCMP